LVDAETEQPASSTPAARAEQIDAAADNRVMGMVDSGPDDQGRRDDGSILVSCSVHDRALWHEHGG
jgi:hypothetical protein